MITPRLKVCQTDGAPYCPVPEIPPSRKGPSRSVVLTLVVFLAASTAAVVLKHREAATPLPPPPGSSPLSLPQVVAAGGEMEPLKEVKISPEVSGEIIELPVKEGQRVNKGDVLVRIKPDFYQANRDQAEGNCKSALASRDLASARLEEARAELKRTEDLFRNKLVSEAAFEQAKTACKMAQAQLSIAEGQLETARASLARALYDLDKTTILSPITGTVAKLNSQVGERVVGTATMAGTQVMTLADLNNMEARVEVGERDIGLIGCGQKAQLELNAFPGHSFAGTVLEIATSSENYGVLGESSARKATKFQVTIRLQGQQHFRPGMSVTARIQPLSETAAEPIAPKETAKTPTPPAQQWTG